MSKLTGQVSLTGILNAIAEEVASFDYNSVDSKNPLYAPHARGENEEVIGDVSGSEAVKKLFALKVKYAEIRHRQGLSMSFTGQLPTGETDEYAVEVDTKADLYDTLFWSLVRGLTGSDAPGLGIRSGWLVVPLKSEIQVRPLGPALQAALRRGGQSGLVN